MTGTFSDPDGDAVTLTASVGTVTDTGGGTWSWTHTATDGRSEFVYITATDANGHKDQAVFQQRVTNQPPTADADGPYATNEGTGVALNATGSTDPNGDALTYDWDLDNDGLFDDATGVSPTFTPGDDGAFAVAVKVTDPSGASDTDSSHGHGGQRAADRHHRRIVGRADQRDPDDHRRGRRADRLQRSDSGPGQ